MSQRRTATLPKTTASSRAAGPRPRRTLRLAETVHPKVAGLHLHLSPRSRVFRGEVTYQLVLDKRCRSIELHAADLVLKSASATVDGVEHAATIEMHPECETVLFRFDRALAKGQLSLRISFKGRVRDDLRGMYRGRDRKQPWLASQLCPTDARRVFPCFDEPGIKARYNVSVTAPAEDVVLSNAPVQKRSRAVAGSRTTHFEQTPLLSAYLIAVAVGPFESGQTAQVGKTPIRVYSLKGQRPLGKFALEAAAESLIRLEKWFGMPHPYAKLDLVALPDFAFGAMENAGAVFFRDSVLLLDEKESSPEDRLRTAETIAHELAHMWFGNLVTMAWWNDLWLNESFATWMAYEIVHDWKPEWRIWLEFVARRENAFELDALASSHPIAPQVKTADEANENFDAITYTKGASVLRMLERYVGASAFRKGVRTYIRRHRNAAAAAEDLWAALEEASSLPIESIVRPWTTETGYPVVRAKSTKNGQTQLTQERFLLLPKTSKPAAPKQTWSIPWIGRSGALQASSRSKPAEHRSVLMKRSQTLPLPNGDDDWLYANADEAGFYRVDHGNSGVLTLIEALPRLTASERIGWIGHQWALVRAGQAQIDTILRMIAAFGEESDPDVLFAAERVLASISRRLAPDVNKKTTERLAAWITIIFGRQIDTVGWRAAKNEPAELTRQRTRAFSIVGGLGSAPAISDHAKERVEAFFASGQALPRGAEDVMLSIGARDGDPGLQAEYLEATRTARTPQERRRFLFALSGFERSACRKRTLRATLDAKLAPGVDRATMLMGLLSSPRTAEMSWEHLQTSWSRLESEMPPILLARLAGETANALPLSRCSEIAPFFAAHPLAAGDRVLRQVREQIALSKSLRRHAGHDLQRFLGGD